MYKYRRASVTTIEVNTATEGETIEQKVEGIVNNGEGVEEGADLIYTERRDGVLPEHNIRTDRWEIAVGATDYADRTHKAKREERHNPKKEEPKQEPKERLDSPNTEGK